MCKTHQTQNFDAPRLSWYSFGDICRRFQPSHLKSHEFQFFTKLLTKPSSYAVVHRPTWPCVMDVLGVGEEGDPWKTPKRRWNAAEMKIRARRALGNGGFWWRWRVEVKLWYGRWLEEMKEKISHVCSQNNRRVEWSQHKHSIRNFKS